MESQIAHEITELSVLQCRPSEHGVELMKGWEEYLALGGKGWSKAKKKGDHDRSY